MELFQLWVSTWELVLGPWWEGGFSSSGCPTSPWDLGVSWAGSLGDERVSSPSLCPSLSLLVWTDPLEVQ